MGRINNKNFKITGMNKNYSYFEYEESQRDNLSNLYDQTFPEDKFLFENGKDLKSNTSTKVTITKIDTTNGITLAETPFGQGVVIDTKKEEKGFKKLGYPYFDPEIGQVLDVVITKDSSGNFSGSLSAGYEKALRRELHNAIKNEDCAYNVKVTSVCNGGFMVDLSGIQCFLPGSLAAANRIMNFAEYVGKGITVMVEIYDQKRDIFVVSFKKYLKKIIDSKVKDLSFVEKYEGVVTGASNTGVFVEWEEIYTGIIPFDESNRPTLEQLKAGDSVSFYVVDIKNAQRVALSVQEPNDKLKNIQSLKDNSLDATGGNEGKTYDGEVAKIKNFGVFVKLDNGLNGLIEKERLSKKLESYEVGQKVTCMVSNVDSSSLKVQLIEVNN